MKFGNMVLLVAGIAVIGGLLYAGAVGDRRDSEQNQIRVACLTIGEVAQDCDRVMPDVPKCMSEDCSDIREALGYWRDPHDGRLWLVRAPWLIIASQSAQTAG